MATKWSEVASNPKFQSATPEQQKAIADGFFNEVIKPDLPAGQNLEAVKTEFLGKVIPKQPSVTERISAGLSDLITPRTVVNPNTKPKPSTFKNNNAEMLPTVAQDRVKDAQFRANSQLVNQGFEPEDAATITTQMDSQRIDRLNQEAVKPVDMRYAKKMTEKPARSIGDYYKDTAGAVVKIPGAVVRDVANIGNMLTGDTMPTDVAGTMQRGMDEFDRRFGSDAKNYENQEFGSIANNKNQGFGDQVDYLLQNPTLLADKGITTIGSMFIPAGVSAGAMGVASKLFGGNIPAKLEAILKNGTIAGTVAMQNAAETFNDEELKALPLDKRYEAAGITALGTLLGNKIFGGGIERAIADKFNKSGAAQGFALAGKEAGQEAFESLSGSAGKAAAAPGSVSLNQAVGNALTEGMIGGVMGGGVAAVGLSGNSEQALPADQSPINESIEMPGGTINVQASKGQRIIDHLKKLKGVATPQQSSASEAVNISDLIGGENVSNLNQGQATQVATATLSDATDNAQGSAGTQLSDTGARGMGDATTALGASSAGNIQGGVDANGRGLALIDQKANEAATSQANDLAEPTQAQKDAGNYKKGKVKLSGLDISIENPDGSTRSGTDPDGNQWQSTMRGHYGYIKGVKARSPDKEHVDTFIKPGTAPDYDGNVYIVNQNDPKTGQFDEAKVMIGYASAQEAKDAYMANYQQGWQGFGDMVTVDQSRFKKLLDMPRVFKKPIAAEKQRPAKPKANTLLTTIDAMGGLDPKYKWDVSGEQSFARAGYNRLFRNTSKKTLEEHVQNGDLDEFLPYELRSTVKDDPTEARDYLADKIRNGVRVIPYDEQIAIDQELANNQIDDEVINEIADMPEVGVSIDENDDIGFGLGVELSQEESDAYWGTVDEQNDTAASSGQTEQPITRSEAGSGLSDNEDSPAEESGGKTISQNEIAGTPREKAREVLAKITRLRRVSQELNKLKSFENAVKEAKRFIDGENVTRLKFKDAAMAHKNAPELESLFNELHALSKEQEQSNSGIVQAYKSDMEQAKTITELLEIARKIQKDSRLTQSQATSLDAINNQYQDAIQPPDDAQDKEDDSAPNPSEEDSKPEVAEQRPDLTLQSQTEVDKKLIDAVLNVENKLKASENQKGAGKLYSFIERFKNHVSKGGQPLDAITALDEMDGFNLINNHSDLVDALDKAFSDAQKATNSEKVIEKNERPELTLQQETNEEILAREKAQKAEEDAKAKEAAKAKADAERADAKKRIQTQAGNVDNFVMGESSREAAKPQRDIFGGTNPTVTMDAQGSNSAQFNEYKNWIEKGNIVSAGMAEQIKVDERLNDGEAEILLSLQPTKNKQFAKNKVFTADKVEAARARLKSKLNTLNSGIDPELLVDGMTIAGAYIESGVRSFADYSKAMVGDFGESIKPYLLSFYEAARAYPGIEKDGMTSAADAKREYDALITPAIEQQAAVVVGNGKVKADKKPAKKNGDMTLTQDWGVSHIDGWTDNAQGTGSNDRENGVKNGVKDQFLAETKRYLNQVAALLEEAGFEPYKLKNGKTDKAVSVNEAGPAVSGDVTLSMRAGDYGVYVSIGESSVSFMSGRHPQRISIMARAFNDAENKRWSGGNNNWLPTDLNATSLADKLISLASNIGLGKSDSANAQGYVKTNQSENSEVTENARPTETRSVPRATPQNDLFTEQPRDSNSESLAPGVARASEEATANEPVRGNVQEPSGTRARSTRQDDGDGSPSPAREDGNAGNQPSATNDRVSDFEITESTALGQGSAGEKYRNNVTAIKLIKQLESEKRQATPEERETLAKYAGFGALSGVFDRNNNKFAKEYAELKELLTDDEYSAARASIRNAYYTSPAIVKSMYDAIGQLGFKNGRVLEPSLGSGNFFGMMPAGMRNKSQLNGVELDVITSRLAKYLYPNANIATSTGFQDYNAPNGYFDLVISNPPFGDEKLTDTDKTPYSGFSIHNYFIAKSIDKLRDGGLMAVVVSHSFMDANSPKAREWIAQNANLIGAVRLPKEAFKDIAGTEVITDILYFQKTANLEQNPAWVNSSFNGKYSFNDYFAANPRNVLGRITDTTNQFGVTYTVETVKGTLQQNLKEFNSRLPQSIYVAPTKRTNELDSADSTVPDGVKVGTFYADEKGVIRQRLTDTLNQKRSQQWEAPNNGAMERMLGMMAIRDLLRTQMRLERTTTATTDEIERNRKRLNQRYDEFLNKYGYLNSATNRRIFMDDTESALLQALELDYDQGVSALKAKSTGMDEKPASATKADIFKQRVLFPPSDMVTVQNAKDALLASLNAKGAVDIDYMIEAYNKPEQEIINELGDVIYKDPVNGYVTADEYLSGDVKTKLAEAQYAEKTDSSFKRNVEALQKVIPKDKLPSEIFASPGANWIPHKVYEQFASEITGIPAQNMRFTYLSATATWLHERGAGGDIGKLTSDYGTEKLSSYELFVMLINGKTPEITFTVRNLDGTKTTNTDIAATEEARSKYQKIKELWDSWLYSDANRADELATIYNDKHNRVVNRKYDGQHMTFAGMTPVMNGKAFAGLRPHQKDVVWRAIQDRNVLLDHVVGAGKTMAMAATAMEMKRLGIARKPLFIVPNHLTLQWRSEFTKLYPASNILAATPDDFAKDKRERMFSKMVTGNYDAIIIGHSSLKKIGLPAEIEQRMYNEQVEEIASAIEQMKQERGDRSIVRDMEKIRTNLEAKIKDLKEKAGEKDNVVSFDELGVDALFIDEMHEFKNLFFTTQMQRTSGLGNPKGSGKALDLFMKIKWLTERLGEKAPIITATGTPVSNSLAEMFTMQRYMKFNQMKRDDLHLFDAWAKQYGEVENVYEVAPSGVGYRQSTRFSKFKNLPSLMASYNTFADVITLQDLKDQTAQQLDADGNPKKFPVPKLKTGKPVNVIAKRSDLQSNFFGVPKLATDADGNILFEIDPETASIQKNDQGKFILRHTNGSSMHETQEEAELELASKSLSPKTYLDPESLLGKFANLKELTRETKGKVNALSLTGLANKAGLDYRLIDPNAPDFADSKINKAVTNMVQEYKDTTKDKGTQIIFCDMSIPNSARASMASKEKRVYVRDGKYLVTHKSKGTVYSPEGYEGYPFYLVKETAGIAVYEAVSGINLMAPTLVDRTEAKAWLNQFIELDGNRDRIYSLRDQYAIDGTEIDEYRDEKELEVAEDGSNEISLDDLEALAGSSKFSVYDDIKAKLIAQGVPENEIAFIHDYNTPKRKEMLFKQVNRGEVRFLFGSTPKLGAGTNVQERLVALHHIDAPWRPSDLEQREGRIIRQGNKLYERDPEGFEVGVYRYATEQTYDTRRWQLLEHKAAGIEQLRKYSGESEIEDVTSEAANSADMKAAASGNPLILEETKLRTEVKRLKSLQKAHSDSKFSMARKIKSNETAIAERYPEIIAMYQALIDTAKANPVPSNKEEIANISIDGLKTTNKAKAEDAIADIATRVRQSFLINDSKRVIYRGIEFTLALGFSTGELNVSSPDGNLAYYKMTDSFSPSGFITRLNNYIESFDARIKDVESYAENARKENESLKSRVDEPFEFDETLKQTQSKHADIQRRLMKSTQLDAIPKNQVDEFKKLVASRKEQLKRLGYENAVNESERDTPMFSRSSLATQAQLDDVAKLFKGMASDSKVIKSLAQRKAKKHEKYDEISKVEAGFYDMLGQLEDAGLIKINC